jgi:hypothetical protein
MTVSYKENVIIIPREIKAKILKENSFGEKVLTETRITIKPNENPYKDVVTIKKKGSDKETSFTGSEIKSSNQCKEFGIEWWDPAAKKTQSSSWHSW